MKKLFVFLFIFTLFACENSDALIYHSDSTVKKDTVECRDSAHIDSLHN